MTDHANPPGEVLDELLDRARVIAVVGASPKQGRPSHDVASFLMGRGYAVVPVNPAADSVLGLRSYRDLASVPEKIDVVDVFRRGEEVMPIAEAAISVGARALWMQEGIRNEDAARLAVDAGLIVVMDKCIKRHLTSRG